MGTDGNHHCIYKSGFIPTPLVTYYYMSPCINFMYKCMYIHTSQVNTRELLQIIHDSVISKMNIISLINKQCHTKQNLQQTFNILKYSLP